MTIDTAQASGVLFSHGARFGGHSLSIKDGFAFTGGTIKEVIVDISDDHDVDLEREAIAIFARE